MEAERIKPGKPMDDATWIKYLRQGNVPVRLVVKGRTLIGYDIRFHIKAVDARFGGYSYIIQFGNYFREHPELQSMLITNGKPFKTEQIVCFFDPTVETHKAEATAIEVVPDAKRFRVNLARRDSKRIVGQFLQAAKDTGQMIPLPRKLGASVVVDCTLVPVTNRPYFILQIDNKDRNETEGDTPAKRNKLNYNQGFIQNLSVKKPKPDTDILDRIKAATLKKEFFKVLVTPVMAEDLLMRNTGNRHLSMEDVYDYAAQREAGIWKWTNQSTLGFDYNGVLTDGQHKLFSQIKAGVDAEMVIFCGLDPDVFEVTDAGRKRTPGDTLSVDAIPNANQAAAITTFIIYVMKFGKVSNKRRRLSNHEIREWIKDEKNKRRLFECMSFTETTLKKYGLKLLSLTIWAGMLYILSLKNRSEAEYFLEKLATGEDQSRTDNSPIWHLRKVLEKWEDKADLPQGQKASHAKVSAIIEAWNLFRQKDGKDRPLIVDKFKFDPFIDELPKISR